MKIKMKVKHLVYSVLGLMLFGLGLVYLVLPQLDMYKIKQYVKEDDDHLQVQILETLDNPKIFSAQKWELIRHYMIGETLEDQYNVYVGPSFSQVNDAAPIVSFTWEEKLPFLKKYLSQAPLDDMYVHAIHQVANYYMENGEQDKIDDLFAQAQRRIPDQDAWIPHELTLTHMDVAIQAGNFDKAKELLKKEKTDDYYYQAKLDQREIEIAIQENQMETALEKTNQALEKYKTGEKKEQEEFPDEDFYLSGMTDIEENLLSIQKSVQRAVSKDASNVGTVTGKITKLGGTPVSHAGVFLRKQGDVNRSVSRLEPYQTKTDRHGNYSIDGVVPGSYQLSLGFDFSQIDGYTWPVDMDDWIDVAGERGIDYDVTLHPLMEITSPVNEEKITGQQVNFSWMAVENAAYYELHLNVEFEGGSMSTVFQSHIKNNQLTVPMEKLYQHEISRILPDDDLKYRSVGQLLGLTDPDSRYAWSVQAYNAKDELITKSDGYRLNEDTIGDLPFFYLKGRKMTAADDLLREGKFKKALEAYQIAYEKDSSDMHSLQMITRLINLEGSPEDIWETEKAIPYVKAFVEKTKNPQAINRLMDYYKSERNWEAFHQYFSLYKQVHKGQIDVYDSQMYAQALMEEGRLREAEQIFMETEKKDKSHRFIGNLLAVKLYQGTSFQEVEQLAVDFPQRSFGGWDDPDWLKLIRDLRENGEGDDNYRKKLNTALDAYFTGDEAAMKGIVDPVIKQFIEAEKGVK